MADMTSDFFAKESYGKLALEKIKPENPDFRLYYAGWLGEDNRREVMEVRGAVFRKAKSGPNKDRLAVMVSGTQRNTYMTAEEIRAFGAKK